MPAILPNSAASPSKVLVTGGTGYIGPWVIKYLLEDGFRVRAVVRDEGSWKTGALKEFFASYISRGEGGDNGKLEFCVVEDFLKVCDPSLFPFHPVGEWMILTKAIVETIGECIRRSGERCRRCRTPCVASSGSECGAWIGGG
jgi:nucleoside-diphosphate-sugar epimerase